MLGFLCFSVFEKQPSNIYLVDMPLWICLARETGAFTPQETMADIHFRINASVSLSQSSDYVLNGNEKDFEQLVKKNANICHGASNITSYNIYIFSAKNRVCLYTCYQNDAPRIIRYEVTIANQTQNSFFVVYKEIIVDRTDSQRYLLTAYARIDIHAVVSSRINIVMTAQDVYNSYIVTNKAFLMYHKMEALYNKGPTNMTRYLLEKNKCDAYGMKYSNLTGKCEEFIPLAPISALSHQHQMLLTIPPKGYAAQLCFEQQSDDCNSRSEVMLQECSDNPTHCDAALVEEAWAYRNHTVGFFDCLSNPANDPSINRHITSKVYCVNDENDMLLLKNHVVLFYSVSIVLFVVVLAYSIVFVCRFRFVSMIKKRQSLFFLAFFQRVEASIYNAKKHQEAQFWQENEIGTDDGFDDVQFEQTADQEAAESSVFNNSVNRDYDIFVQISWLFAYPRREEQDYYPEQQKDEVFQLKAFVKDQLKKFKEGERTDMLNFVFNMNSNQVQEQYIMMEGDDTDYAYQYLPFYTFNQQKLNIKDTSSESNSDTELLCKVNRIAEKSDSEFGLLMNARLGDSSESVVADSEGQEICKSRSTRSNMSQMK